MPRPRTTFPADLRRTALRIRAWRRTRARRPLPPELWRVAAALARRHGVSAAAKALRLDYYALVRRAKGRSEAKGRFVEVVPAPATAPCVVEIEDGRGGTMRVRLSGEGTVAHVEALGRLFLGRRG